jgi:homoserine kinase type II
MYLAVYTTLSDNDIEKLLENYDLGTFQQAFGIAEGVENTNYLILVLDAHANEQKYILTVYEKRVRPEDLPFFMGMLEHLTRHGVPCPKPIAAKDGSPIQTLLGKPVTIVSFLQGRGCRNSGIQSQHLQELGKHTALMHNAIAGFTPRRENNLSVSGWKQLQEKIGPRADEIEKGLTALLAEEMQYLKQHWPTHLPAGVIHADLFPDNVFYIDQKLTGIIDFYFSCNDILIYDLAIIINAWCFEQQREFNVTKARALLREYHAVRPISNAELEALPILCRGAALRFLLTRAYDWLNPVEGAVVTPKDPMEYVRKLRFHQSVKQHGEYGL